jgi:hypothetical protein
VRAPADKPTVFRVKNLDGKAMEFESKSLCVEKVVSAKSEGVVNVRAMKAGRYEFYDDFNDKARGALNVQQSFFAVPPTRPLRRSSKFVWWGVAMVRELRMTGTVKRGHWVNELNRYDLCRRPLTASSNSGYATPDSCDRLTGSSQAC